MVDSSRTVVLKFGSSVLRSAHDLHVAVEEIYRYRRQTLNVVAVVSAFQGRTDQLIDEAEKSLVGQSPVLVADHIARGERESVEALMEALDGSGIPATRGDPQAIGLLAEGPILDASPVDLDVRAIELALRETGVLIIPGFLGWHETATIALLGRGGSDLSALFIAHRLKAQICILVKDTPGVYESDPNVIGQRPRRFRQLSFHDALRIDGQVIQRKALHFAFVNRLPFEVRRAADNSGSLISALETIIEDHELDSGPPLRIAIYGHGKVGRELARRLRARPDHWSVVGICVRDRTKHGDVEPELLLSSLDDMRARPTDIVVELIGGSGLAGEIIEDAMGRGQAVVTANKEIMAERGDVLTQEARLSGTELRFSAAVGGSVPVLENLAILRGSREITAIHGILNGSSNAILGSLGAGLSLPQAVAHAQEQGLCESDPADDLDGRDALRKLVIISRTLFDREPDLVALGPGIRGDLIEKTCKQVATLRKSQTEVRAEVQLRSGYPEAFGSCRGAENIVMIERASEETLVLRGLGAGPRPTAEAVLADLLDLRREWASPRSARREELQT